MKTLTRLLAAIAAALILVTTASPAAGSSGLVGHWPLDEGAGVQVADTSGFGNNGVLSGGATWVASGSGSALSFDGLTGKVKVPNNPSLEPASAVTVSAWVRHAGSPGDYRYIVAKGATGCIAASYGLYTGPDGGLEFYVSQSRGTAYAPSPDDGFGVWDGHWHLVVGTFDGASIRLFVDGTEVGSGTAFRGSLEYVLPDSNDLYIGDYTGCAQHEFLGVIDDVSVWDRALTSQQVRSLAPAQGDGAVSPPGPPSPPAPAGAGRQPNAGGSSGSGTPGSRLPSLTDVRATTKGKLGRARPRPTVTITYTDTQGARVTLTLVRVESGQRIGLRCLTPRQSSTRRAQRCTRLVVIGGYTHLDRPGRTTLRFTGLPGHRLVRGRYRLNLTPRSGGMTGTTVVVAFTVR
ncbi:MAG TPA: LamG domain-containing protein [Solirubrobacteraceae bacterium]|nr:LamG domain-containing protein [Solirubrobacteraceae bacterium]